MTKLILGAVLALVLFAPASAAGTPSSTAEGDIPLAEAFWGGPPTQCTSLTIGFTPGPDAGLATQPAPGESNGCTMQLTEVGTIEPVSGWVYTAEYVCLIVVHEEGHLHGYGHSTNPDSIMFGGLPLSAAEVPECVEPVAPAEVKPTLSVIHVSNPQELRELWLELKALRSHCRLVDGRAHRRCRREVRELSDFLRA